MSHTIPITRSGASVEISYQTWRQKVDQFIRFLTGNDSHNAPHDTFMYRDFYDNGFSPKVVAFLAICQGPLTHIFCGNYALWKHEIEKYLSLFDTPIPTEIVLKRLYAQSLSPLLVAEQFLIDHNHLPQVSETNSTVSSLSCSPPLY